MYTSPDHDHIMSVHPSITPATASASLCGYTLELDRVNGSVTINSEDGIIVQAGRSEFDQAEWALMQVHILTDAVDFLRGVLEQYELIVTA